MTTKAKIITAAMSLICLAITLVFPNDSTLLSIAPVIVTFSAWIFISNNKNIRVVEGIFLALSLIALAACFILGMSYNYLDKLLILKPGAILFEKLDYIPIAIALFLAAFSLALGDIICTHRTNIKKEETNVALKYNELVKQSIVHIK